MIYFLHITRKKFWASEGPKIAEDEWRACLQQDPEFTLESDYAEWRCPADGAVRRLWCIGEDIAAQDPDRAFVDKMLTVAQQLRARLQGDEGEVYRRSSQVRYTSDTPPLIERPSRWTWWRRWLRGGVCTPFFYRTDHAASPEKLGA